MSDKAKELHDFLESLQTGGSNPLFDDIFKPKPKPESSAQKWAKTILDMNKERK